MLLKMGNDVSTDEILPAGAKVLPYRSNIQKIEDFAFERIDSTYVERARAIRATTGHAVWCAKHGLTEKQVDMILAGGLINWPRKQRAA